MILRDKDANSGWTSAADGTLEERRYLCQNWRADVSAIVTSGGYMVEWIKYSPYGIPFGLPGADTDSDGDCDATDITQIQTWIDASAYDVRGDVDLDGDVDSTDKSIAQSNYQGTTSGWNDLTAIGNRKGYAGYEWDGVVSMYHVRHRVLHPVLGRWTRRDPLGYVDEMSVYEYVRSAAVRATDAYGLSSTCRSGGCSSPGSFTQSSMWGDLEAPTLDDEQWECIEEFLDAIDDCLEAGFGRGPIEDCLSEVYDTVEACAGIDLRWLLGLLPRLRMPPTLDCFDQCDFEWVHRVPFCAIHLFPKDIAECIAEEHANHITCYACCAQTSNWYERGDDSLHTCDEEVWGDTPRKRTNPKGKRNLGRSKPWKKSPIRHDDGGIPRDGFCHCAHPCCEYKPPCCP